MTCKTFHLPDGTAAIVCTRGERARRRCRHCGRPATKLCDYPRGKRTCDAPLCEGCAVAVGADRDYCPDHREQELGL